MSEGWYSFAVAPILSKPVIKYFIEKLLDVDVISVNTSIPMPKSCMKRNYLGKKSRYKKAIVKFAPNQSLDSLAGA
jgi:ribosomal protein L23